MNIINRLRKASIGRLQQGVGQEMGPKTYDDSLDLHSGGQT